MKIKLGFDEVCEAIEQWLEREHPDVEINEVTADWKWTVDGDYPDSVEFAVMKKETEPA